MNFKDFWPFKTTAANASSLDASSLDDAEASHPPAESLSAVFSSYSPVEAHIVRGMLEDNGIECVLSNELFAAADGAVANATGGVQVFVRAFDMDQARELMREASQTDTQKVQP